MKNQKQVVSNKTRLLNLSNMVESQEEFEKIKRRFDPIVECKTAVSNLNMKIKGSISPVGLIKAEQDRFWVPSTKLYETWFQKGGEDALNNFNFNSDDCTKYEDFLYYAEGYVQKFYQGYLSAFQNKNNNEIIVCVSCFELIFEEQDHWQDKVNKFDEIDLASINSSILFLRLIKNLPFLVDESDKIDELIDFLRKIQTSIAMSTDQKLIWLGSAEQFGYIFSELLHKDYYKFSGDIDGPLVSLARIFLKFFEIKGQGDKQTTVSNLSRALSATRNKYASRTRFIIPNRKDI